MSTPGLVRTTFNHQFCSPEYANLEIGFHTVIIQYPTKMRVRRSNLQFA